MYVHTYVHTYMQAMGIILKIKWPTYVTDDSVRLLTTSFTPKESNFFYYFSVMF